MRTVRCSGLLGGGGGLCAQGGLPVGCIPACNGADTPCGQTDTCKNITFPQLLLRTVMIYITNLNLRNRAKKVVVGATGRFSREIQKRVPGSESSAFYNIAHKLYLA